MLFFVVAMMFRVVAIILATKIRFLLPLLPNSNNRRTTRNTSDKKLSFFWMLQLKRLSLQKRNY